MPGCPSAPHGHLGMPVGLNNKLCQDAHQHLLDISACLSASSNEKLNAMCPLQACRAGSLMPGCPWAPPGHLGMPVGLNNQFTIKELIDGACYIVMYRKIQCIEKLNAACPLQPWIAGLLMPGCPSAPLGHLGMAVRLNNKLCIAGSLIPGCPWSPLGHLSMPVGLDNKLCIAGCLMP
jgi:hypothetical protein